MSKDLNISILKDFYGQLLTDKQNEMLDMYYNQDLSLSEIAEDCAISRQGVRDSIKRGEKQLLEYEEKLGLAVKFLEISKKIEEMNRIIERIKNPENESEIIRLKEISSELSEEI